MGIPRIAYAPCSFGFIAAGLANGITPRQLCTSFIENQGPRNDVVHPSLFIRPALAEYAHRLAMLPGLVAQAALRYAFERRSLLATLERLGRALPTGLFTHAPLEAQMRRMLSAPGRSNDFRQLAHKLVLVATDLDSGTAAPFGQPGFDHVPISQAVAASAALPGLFPPVPIDGRWYVDGALKKTLHARVLLDMGLDLVLCLNPLVPFDASHPARHRVLAGGEEVIPRLIDGGLPVVLSQTFRTLIHSRLELGMKGYDTSHPGTDVLLFEPDHRDPAMFLANTFGYSQRRRLAEHALRDLQPYFPRMGGPWTDGRAVYDGEMADAPSFEQAFDNFVDGAAAAKPGLPKELVRILARRHGSGLDDLLENVKTVADLGRHFGGSLYEVEVRHLVRDEWAVDAEDVLWRRTKEGLHMTAEQREAFARWLAEQRLNFT